MRLHINYQTPRKVDFPMSLEKVSNNPHLLKFYHWDRLLTCIFRMGQFNESSLISDFQKVQAFLVWCSFFRGLTGAGVTNTSFKPDLIKNINIICIKYYFISLTHLLNIFLHNLHPLT